MRQTALLFLIALVVPAAAFAAPRTALGIFDGWAAFREAQTARCYAIAAPAATIGRAQAKAYASVGYWPRSRVRGQFYIRLSKERGAGRELRLTVGNRRFILTFGIPMLALAAAPAALGVFDGWGAFRDPRTPRCYAIAAPAMPAFGDFSRKILRMAD